MPTSPTPLTWPPAWLAEVPGPIEPATRDEKLAPAPEPVAVLEPTVAQLVSDLRRRGHRFWAYGEQLEVRPAMSPEARRTVATRKQEVLAYIVTEPLPPARVADNGIPLCGHCDQPYRTSRATGSLCCACLILAGWNGLDDPDPIGRARAATSASALDSQFATTVDRDAESRAAIDRLRTLDLT